MVFELDTAKGVRDIPPQDQLTREFVLAVLTKNFRLFGFQPLDTPIIERFDVLSAKFAAGEESDAMKEVYQLQDQGGRELALRFDLTVPLARYVAMNKNLSLPFARYQVGKVYRDAPIRKGRYREFTQCDADIIGADSLIADATCIQLALQIYKDLDMQVTIKVNNRKFLNAILNSYGVDEKKAPSVLTTIDKMDKIGRDGVLNELAEKGVAERENILNDLTREGSTQEKIEYFLNKQCDGQGIDELRELFSYIKADNVVFDPTLARGLGYYTGTVFEVVDATNTFDSSICGGGRYDDLINDYLDAANTATNRNYPAVGISFGLDRMIDVLQLLNKVPNAPSATKLLIVPMDTKERCMQVATECRDQGVATAVDMSDKKLGKVFAYASENNIPFVGVIGENEQNNNTITLKNLESGEQVELSIQDAINKVKSS